MADGFRRPDPVVIDGNGAEQEYDIFIAAANFDKPARTRHTLSSTLLDQKPSNQSVRLSMQQKCRRLEQREEYLPWLRGSRMPLEDVL